MLRRKFCEKEAAILIPGVLKQWQILQIQSPASGRCCAALLTQVRTSGGRVDESGGRIPQECRFLCFCFIRGESFRKGGANSAWQDLGRVPEKHGQEWKDIQRRVVSFFPSQCPLCQGVVIEGGRRGSFKSERKRTRTRERINRRKPGREKGNTG